MPRQLHHFLKCTIYSVFKLIMLLDTFLSTVFLLFLFKDMTDLETYLKGINKDERSQPFVLCLYRESMLLPTQVFVVFERKALAKASLLKAVDGCYKLTYVLNSNFQDNCKLAWHFLQHYIYIYSQGGNEQLAASVRAFRSYVQQIHET